MPKARIFAIMQYEHHPDTKVPLLDERQIQLALAHRTIKRWAYIVHDKDKYSKADELADPAHKEGVVKPRHWHVVLEMKSNEVELDTIAKWFAIQPQYIEMKKGRGAFLDCVEYLTHEHPKQQELGKYLYPDNEVKASYGFDFRAALDKRLADKAKYGREISAKEQQRVDVLQNGKTLLQCVQEDPVLYAEDCDKLKKLRIQYINMLQPPRTRINYYVEGRGGVGKGLFSRGLARTLAAAYNPDLVGAPDDEMYFEVGADGALFEGYDGQPVMIWNDWRAFDLLKALKGRGNVFTVFDTHPTKQRQNVKYSSVNLCNLVNIVNSVQPYQEFLDGLAGEYDGGDGVRHTVEDKGQSYRRFPIIIPIHEWDFDILLNRGFMDGTSNFQEYVEYASIRGNMQRIAERCGANEKLARELEGQVMLPVLEGHKALQAKVETEGADEDAIRAELADFGSKVDSMNSNNKAVNAALDQIWRQRKNND